jgi:hypothetical protein
MKKIIVAVSIVWSTTFSFAQDGKLNFTKAFQQQSTGKCKTGNNEIKELVHLMIAVAKFGFGNDHRVQQQGVYNPDVLKQLQ